MKDRICFILTFVFIFIFMQITFSQTGAKKNIAVIDLDSRGGVSKSEAGTLTDRLRSKIVRANIFHVVDRGKMEDILGEQGFQMKGCTSAECAIEAGKILGVEQMVAGTIGRVGKLFTIDIILIDVETSKIIQSLTRDYMGEIEGLVALMESIANELGSSKKPAPVETIAKGGISVRSEPKPADVFIDNKKVGKSPLKLDNLSTGKHRIKLQVKGYEIFEDDVTIEKGTVKNFSAKLKRLYALKIISSPEKAQVYINNKSVGNAPYVQAVVEGSMLNIKVKKDNYKTWEKSIEITKSMEIKANLELTEEYKQKHQIASTKKGGGKIWWWIGGGAVVAAGAAAVLLAPKKEESKTEEGGFPEPPGRP